MEKKEKESFIKVKTIKYGRNNIAVNEKIKRTLPNLRSLINRALSLEPSLMTQIYHLDEDDEFVSLNDIDKLGKKVTKFFVYSVTIKLEAELAIIPITLTWNDFTQEIRRVFKVDPKAEVGIISESKFELSTIEDLQKDKTYKLVIEETATDSFENFYLNTPREGAEEINPIIYFDKNTNITIDNAMYEFFEKKLIGSNSKVITLIGRTKSGKSTLTNIFLGTESQYRAAEAEPKQGQPTTADIHMYQGKLDNFESIIYLDAEGAGGSEYKIPKCATWIRDDIGSNPKALNAFLKIRAQKVLYHFPRLAYTISDIVVYIDTRPLGDASYKEYLINCSTNYIASIGLKPILFIICNKQVPSDVYYDINESTKHFFLNHDPDEELKKYYSEVRVFMLPMYIDKFHRFKIFEPQVNKVRDEIVHYMGIRSRQKSIVFSERQWLQYLKQIVLTLADLDQKQSQPICVASVLAQVVILDNFESKYASQYFLLLLNHGYDFAMAHENAIKFLACLFFYRLLRMQDLDTANVDFQKNLWKNLQYVDLQKFLDEHIPCIATFENHQCAQTKNTHDKDSHSFPIKESFGAWALRQFMITISVQKSNNRPRQTNWKGAFNAPQYKPGNLVWDENTNHNSDFYTYDKLKQHADELYSILYSYCKKEQILKIGSNSKLVCPLCLSITSVFLKCGHQYCINCVNGIKQCHFCGTDINTKTSLFYKQLYFGIWNDYDNHIDRILNQGVSLKEFDPTNIHHKSSFPCIVRSDSKSHRIIGIPTLDRKFDIPNGPEKQMIGLAFFEFLWRELTLKKNREEAFTIISYAINKLDGPFASLIIDSDSRVLPQLFYYPSFPLHLTRDRIRPLLLQGSEEFVELVLGEPINVRKLSEYNPNNFNRCDARLRQMFHVGDINRDANFLLPSIPPKTVTIYQSLSQISVPNIFLCVDQCENIYEQLNKIKLLDPMNHLSKDQILAILLYIFECSRNYSESLTYLLNKALVKRDPAFEPFLGLLRSAFNNKSEITRQTVYKGIFHGNEELPINIDPIRQLNQGAVFQWEAYSRCTLSLDLAKTYATTTGTILEIENATTLSLSKFGNILSNDELLLSPNAIYKVKQKLHRITGGFSAITLEADQTHPF